MRFDEADGPGLVSAGLRWAAASILVLAIHAGAIALLVRTPELPSTATGGDPEIEVDLEPVEGEKSLDVASPNETSGDPAPSAAAAADAAAAVDAPPPAPPPVVPPPLPEPPEPPKVEPSVASA